MADVAVISDVPTAEKPVLEKDPPPVPEPEPEAAEKPTKAVEAVVEAEKPKPEDEKISEAVKEEAADVVPADLQKKALDELKLLVQEALNKHQFSPPPPTLKAAAEEKSPPSAVLEEAAPPAEIETEEGKETPEPDVVAEVVEKNTASVDDDGAKTVEAIKETIIAVSAPAPPPAAADPLPEPKEEQSPPPPPEEVSIWGIPLLADERSDAVLLKFLRAREFKVKEAFAMLKNTVLWRKDFGIETLIEENLETPELNKVVFLNGSDKEGHPVCYNAFGEFQNKELYQTTFADEEKRRKFLQWRILFLEKSIRKILDFSPDGICSFVQVNDLKNSPVLFKRELRQTTDQALQLLQDNYPEFVDKQVFINVPWWYLAFYRMINPFLTQRTKSKFVFAGPSKSAETLFKYIAPEQVPVEYGGFNREGEQEFTTADPIAEEIIKPSCKHTIEFPLTEALDSVWEVRVIGWDVSYGAEFVPTDEGGYTVIVQKLRKIVQGDETVICGSYKIDEPGKVVLTFDNQTSKKKKLLYRSKTKPSSD